MLQVNSHREVTERFGRRDKVSQARGPQITDPAIRPEDRHALTEWIRDGSVLITPDMAKRIISECMFSGQRKVFYYQVKLLVDKMKNGEWLPNDQISFCKLPDGKMILVNGYHRMTAVTESGIPIIFSIRILDCKDMSDVKRAYITFDTGTRSRSESEVISAMGITEEFNLTKQVAEAVYKAAPLIANKMLYYNYQTSPIQIKNVTQRIMLADDLWLLGKKYQDLISTAAYKHRSKLLMSGVVGVAIATIKHQYELASQFWPRVADMANMKIDDPRLVLAKTLTERKYQANAKDGTVPANAIDSALAWNAFYSGKSITILKTTQIKNFHVKGTTWR